MSQEQQKDNDEQKKDDTHSRIIFDDIHQSLEYKEKGLDKKIALLRQQRPQLRQKYSRQKLALEQLEAELQTLTARHEQELRTLQQRHEQELRTSQQRTHSARSDAKQTLVLIDEIYHKIQESNKSLNTIWKQKTNQKPFGNQPHQQLLSASVTPGESPLDGPSNV